MKNIICNLLISFSLSNVYACERPMKIRNYLMQVAANEAQIANIPEYKQAMLLDKPDYYGLTNNKIALINAYKKSHLKDALTDEQIAQINLLEQSKQEFLKSQNICK